VWGRVLLWGQVVEHADGYRASKARIVSIDGATWDVTKEALADLCEVHGVPAPPHLSRSGPIDVFRGAEEPSRLPYVARVESSWSVLSGAALTAGLMISMGLMIRLGLWAFGL
jgi:hypothetical protein